MCKYVTKAFNNTPEYSLVNVDIGIFSKATLCYMNLFLHLLLTYGTNEENKFKFC